MSDSENSDSEPEYLSKTLEELLKEAELSDPESNDDENLSTVKGSNGDCKGEGLYRVNRFGWLNDVTISS